MYHDDHDYDDDEHADEGKSRGKREIKGGMKISNYNNKNNLYIYLVAECQWFALLFRKLPLEVMHLSRCIKEALSNYI